MVHTRSEERMEVHNQEMLLIKKEASKIPAIEESLTTISQQTEKTHQMLMILMDSIAKERTTTSEKLSDYSAQETGCKKNNEGESSTSRRGENETKERTQDEEGANERNKFKKVEMSVFNGEDTDSWLFPAGRYFQIHKLSNTEKVLVAAISFEGPTSSFCVSSGTEHKNAISLQDGQILRRDCLCDFDRREKDPSTGNS